MKLTVQPRNVFGKKLGSLRKQHLVPGVIYSKHLDATISVSVDEVQLKKAYAAVGTSTALELVGEGIDQLVLIHDYQLHPVRDTLLHVDFLAVKADEAVEAEVQINFVGESSLVKTNIGQIQYVKHTLLVSAFPLDLPHDIVVDISSIAGLDDGIFVKDIDLGTKVKVLEDKDQPIVVAVELSEDDSEVTAA